MPDLTGERFVEALRKVEDGGEPDDIVGLFADDASCGNAAGGGTTARGHEEIRDFWWQDAKLFAGMRSEFHSVIETDGVIALAWTRSGDRDEVQGVSVLEHWGGKIQSFCAYFNPAKRSGAAG